jgi:hypothetical protein
VREHEQATKLISNLLGLLARTTAYAHTLPSLFHCAVAEHMQEASSGSRRHRKEVPLAVLQGGSNPSTLSDYGEL